MHREPFVARLAQSLVITVFIAHWCVSVLGIARTDMLVVVTVAWAAATARRLVGPAPHGPLFVPGRRFEVAMSALGGQVMWLLLPVLRRADPEGWILAAGAHRSRSVRRRRTRARGLRPISILQLLRLGTGAAHQSLGGYAGRAVALFRPVPGVGQFGLCGRRVRDHRRDGPSGFQGMHARTPLGPRQKSARGATQDDSSVILSHICVP